MLLYLAGHHNVLLDLPDDISWRYMASYWMDRDKDRWLTTYAEKSSGPMFLDSGAFSARKAHFDIPVEDLAAYIKDRPAWFGPLANLDVGTYENQRRNLAYLDKHFDGVLPVFHPEGFTSAYDRDWFDDEMRTREMVAIGGTVGGSRTRKDIDRMGFFEWIMHRSVKYGCRVHGFGVTDYELLVKYPFFSVDSTSWQTGMRYGQMTWFDPMQTTMHSNKTLSELKTGNVHTLAEAEYLHLSYDERGHLGIRTLYQLETFITSLWERKGITFQEPTWMLRTTNPRITNPSTTTE